MLKNNLEFSIIYVCKKKKKNNFNCITIELHNN